MKKSRKEKSKKRDAFRGAAVLIITALLVTGLLLTACPAPTPDVPTPDTQTPTPDTPTPDVNKYKVTLENTSGGNVKAEPKLPDDGMVVENTVLTFTATKLTGYKFVKWQCNDADVGTATEYKLKVTGNVKVKALFESDGSTIWTCNVTLSPSINGTVTSNPPISPGVTGIKVPNGSEITFRAEPDADYVIDSWVVGPHEALKEGGTPGSPTATIKVDRANGAAITVAVVFRLVKFQIDFDVEGGNGELSALLNGKPFTSGSKVQGNSTITFTAAPYLGFTVEKWTVDGTAVEGNLSDTYTHTVTKSAVIKVKFKPLSTAIVYGENGQGLKAYLQNLAGEPETVHKIEVTGIPETALSGTISQASQFAKILEASGKKIALKLPADLPKIGKGALKGCSKLISADLSECTNITSIDAAAFTACAGLTEIKLPKELTKIANFAFSGCTNLKALDLSDCTALTEIKPESFLNCSIETLSINCDVKETIITNLTQVPSVKAAVKHLTIGEKVGSIEEIEAFGGYVIDSLTINRDVKETIITNLIYLSSIQTNLKKLTLGEGCKMIGGAAFGFYSELLEADLSACTDLAIHPGAFSLCTEAKVKLPASVASIGNEAFGSEDDECCKNVLIPASNYEALKALVIGSGYPESKIIRY